MKRLERFKRTIQFLVVALFIFMAASGGSQIFLSPQRVAVWIKDRLPDYENLDIEFSKAQISFSGSLFPLFGIKAKGVKVRYHDCTTSYQLNAPYVLVPFYLTEALRKKIRFGYLKVGDVDVQILKKDDVCIGQTQESEKSQTESISRILDSQDYEKLFEALQKPFRGARGLKMQRLNVFKPVTHLFENPSAELKQSRLKLGKMNHLETESLEVVKEKEKIESIKNSKHSEVQRLRVTYDRSSEAILVSGGVKVQLPGFDSFRNLPIYWLSVEFQKEAGLKLNVQARYNEGRFYLSSDYQKNLENLQVKWNAVDFPLSFVVRTLDRDEFFSQINTHLVWLNGEGLLGLSFAKTSNVEVLANSLRLRGDLIDAYAQDMHLKLYPSFKVERPFEWRLEKLDLEQISDFLYHKGIRGVLRRAGHIRGSGLVNDIDNVMFEGSVEGLEFFFSSSDQKAFQKVEKAEMNMEYDAKSFKLDFERITFAEGDVEGNTSFTLNMNDDNAPSWVFRSVGQSLRFNDDVYNLFSLKPMSFDRFDIFVKGQKKKVDKIVVTSLMDECVTNWGTFEDAQMQIYSEKAKRLTLGIKSKVFHLDPKYIKTKGVIPVNMNQVAVNMRMNLDIDKSNFEFISGDSRHPFKLVAKEFDYRNDLKGELKKAGKVYDITGDLKRGFEINTPVEIEE